MPDMAVTVGDAETETVTAAFIAVPPLDDGPDVACTPVLLSMLTQDVDDEEEEEVPGGGAVAAAAAYA